MRTVEQRKKMLKNMREHADENAQRIEKVMKKMNITGSLYKKERRKCFNCGKEFISSSTYIRNGKWVITGPFTCSIECTDDLIIKGVL